MPAGLNLPSTDVPVMQPVTNDPSGVVDPGALSMSASTDVPPVPTIAAPSMPFIPVGGSAPAEHVPDLGPVPEPPPMTTPTPKLTVPTPVEDTAIPTPTPAVPPAMPVAETPVPATPSPTGKNLAINGFGRIGRTAFRVWWDRFRDQTELSVINTSGSSDLATWAHLLKYDSNYGAFPAEVTFAAKQTKDQVTDADPELGTLTIDGHTITVLAQKDPAKIPWSKYGVHTVIESTGKFVTQESASAHLQGGAQRVIVSAPPKGEGEQGAMAMTLLGVQETLPTGQVLSNASCTTNCVAPVVSVMQSAFGIEKAMLTTIHAYTDDQNLHDNSHKDLRRSRAAALNIVPTSTGAAKSVGGVIPEVTGKFDGLAVRVPVAVGSLSDIVFITSKDVTVEQVNAAFQTASQEARWKGILAVTKDPIVSSDIVGRSESAIVDLSLTQVVAGNMVKVIAWYDNEFGYCNRLVEVATSQT
jgi:glyceraldehyde 3-phosphate dehydrogenase